MQDQNGERAVGGGDAQESVCGKSEKGEYNVAIGPLDRADIWQLRKWRNDYRIWQWCRQNDFISDVDQENWFDRQAKDPTIKMYKVLVGYWKDKKVEVQMVGACGLTSLDLYNRRAEFSLYIGPEYWGQRFGAKALKCLLTHGFTNLGLNIIWGEVFDGNDKAMDTFLDLGFLFEGTRRDFYFKDGKFIDAHLVSMRADEWKIKLSLES